MKTPAILLAVLLTTGFNRVETGAVKGKITDANTGKPVTGASVVLQQSGKQVLTAKCSPDGLYSLTPVDPGTYSLAATAPGYQPAGRNGLVVRSGQTPVVNLQLVAVKPQRVDKADDAKLQLDVLSEAEESVTSYSREQAPPNPTQVYMRKGYTANAGQGVYSGLSIQRDATFTQHNTESYDAINENIFKEVLDNPLSTFSVDVDKASYSNVRRFITQSQQPPKDAVRIEELINYFDYDYPQPQSADPFSINFEKRTCPWNQENELILIGLQGKKIESQEVPASNLVFLIDVSGSMGSANKLPLLKQAFKILVDNLRQEDRVAMVVYAGAAGVVLESTSGDQKAKIIGALDNLQAGGSTAGGAGINLAYKIAKENFIQQGNNRVILATDGDFNVGASSNGEMVRLIEEKRGQGVFLSILGFGMGNYKDSKMETISNAGNGNYAYIDNILEAKKVFGKELWGTLYTIAKDVKIQVEFNPEKVKAYRLIGYENRILNKEDFNDDKKDAGDIGSGHTVTALYEIVPAGSGKNVSDVDPLSYQMTSILKSNDLMTVKLRYKKPDEDVSAKIVRTIRDKDLAGGDMSDNFKLAASVAEFGMLLRASEHKAGSSYEQALALAEAAKGQDPFGYRQEYINLLHTAQLLAR